MHTLNDLHNSQLLLDPISPRPARRFSTGVLFHLPLPAQTGIRGHKRLTSTTNKSYASFQSAIRITPYDFFAPQDRPSKLLLNLSQQHQVLCPPPAQTGHFTSPASSCPSEALLAVSAVQRQAMQQVTNPYITADNRRGKRCSTTQLHRKPVSSVYVPDKGTVAERVVCQLAAQPEDRHAIVSMLM